MTREEAIKHLHNDCYINNGQLCVDGDDKDSFLAAVGMGIKALRPISREQMEKVWKGEWEWYDEEVGLPFGGTEREWGWRCSKCKIVLPDDFDDPDNHPAMRFCHWCGSPMTDKAVQMVMEKLEALNGDL